ncbi:hypothetical protein JHW43_005470 [Diplocarpon mali]|nr:hypothetical protein JHW43_005470 [Diplocarpon mali]
MSSPPEDVSLSRAISQIDLKTALNAVQTQAATGLQYTRDTMLSVRPKDAPRNNMERVEVAAIPSPEGIMTPPYKDSPAPPPSTPATPVHGAGNTVADAPKVQTVVGAAAPKKKKNKKSSGKNKKPPPTGFEEFFADPPITPDEFDEERDLYDENRPFEDRIESCIQRYRARRKLDGFRSNVLTKYFMLGGVEATNKAFTGGLDKETVENSTAAEIAAITASDFVRTGTTSAKYYDGSADWVIDFEGVAKGYFSHRVPHMFPIDAEKDVIAIANVIRNFLNYVLQHEVCPEYTLDVMAARAVCDLAEKELWAIRLLNWSLPGDFAIAASTLYGGRFKDIYLGRTDWVDDDPDSKEIVTLNQGFSDVKAERVFMTGIAFAGNDDLFVETSKGNVHIVNTESKFFEVATIQRPDVQSIEAYAAITDHEGKAGNIKALGTIGYKLWEGPGLEQQDLTDEELAAEKLALQSSVIEYFWLEDDILQHFFVGMKLEATVHELNIGIKFIDSYNGVFCSFYTVLPNEKMIGWKDPVPNPRLPPTVDDPEIEERAIEAAMDNDLKTEEKEFAAK